MSVKHYELELKNLDATRAEFGEVVELAKPPVPIIFGDHISTINYTNITTNPAPAVRRHTWVLPRQEWEEMGRPLTVYVRVSNAR